MITRDLTFRFLPDYAGFLLENHFEDFYCRYITLAASLEIPFLEIVQHMDTEEKHRMLKAGLEKLLRQLSINQADEYIRTILEAWHQNRLNVLDSAEIAVSDVKRYNYSVKAAMVAMIQFYSTDLSRTIKCIQEMDLFFMTLEESALNLCMKLYEGRVAVLLEAEQESGLRVKERERQLLEAQELGGMGSFDWDLTTGINEVTPQLEKILGVQNGSSLSALFKSVHPEDIVRVKRTLDEAISSNGSFDVDFRIMINGAEKLLWSRGIVFSSNGKPSSLRGTLIDVTEKHQLMARFSQSEALYKEAQRLASLGNWTWDFITGKLFWSEELYNIFGIEPFSEDMDFEKLQEYIHPDDREMRMLAINQAIESHQSYSIYYRIIQKNGVEKILLSRGSASYNEQGQPIRLIGTAQDVTAQMTTKKMLAEQQAFIKKIADATPAIITTYDVHARRFGFISHGIELLLGYRQDLLSSTGVEFLIGNIHPEDLKNVLEQFNGAISTMNQSEGEDQLLEVKFRIKNADGNYRWMNCFGTIFDRNERGKVNQILTIAFDNTVQVEAENKILQQTLELQQSNANLEEFAHVASHDLKEPLRKISNFADRLQSFSELLPDNGRDYLKKIIDSALRMQVLIDDLLSVSVISAEKSFTWYPLRKILNDVLESLELKIEERKARIQIELDYRAYIIPGQFRQLFQNLLLNSLKFTRKNEAPEIEISGLIVSPWAVKGFPLKAADSYLQIKVADSGIGFDPQFASQIFAIFQRLHGKSVYEGTGIGLAICKKIVENHGGVIFANAQQNKGAVFTIILPLTDT